MNYCDSLLFEVLPSVFRAVFLTTDLHKRIGFFCTSLTLFSDSGYVPTSHSVRTHTVLFSYGDGEGVELC
jgi:hypothetical protein